MASPSATLCFLETQFPTALLSEESFRERKAVSGQTLTGLGKWWGRKPLILCRAILLGVLLPASSDPARDRGIFLKLLTMDDDGLRRRKNRRVTVAGPRTEEEVFASLPYPQQLTYCRRPEQIDGPSRQAWEEINGHLGTTASSLPELVEELSRRRFGRRLRVGDAFCGGGSLPFEAARLGCDVCASDLNPVAALLTWAALNLLGGGPDQQRRLRVAQDAAYAAVDRQLTTWGIEHNSRGDRADAFLYCVETCCPACGWRVPLAPSWVIAEKTRCAAILVPNSGRNCFEIGIESDLDSSRFRTARASGTVKGSRLVCPNRRCRRTTSLAAIRGEGGLRSWEQNDLVPRPDDVWQERLYCVRWVRPGNGSARYYASPTPADQEREVRALELLRLHLADWQAAGFVPTRPIEAGLKTEEPMRVRGFRYWHHLFHPRQLLQLGLFARELHHLEMPEAAAGLLLLGRLANWNSRLCRWLPTQGGGIGGGKDTFDNQALNPLHNFCVRGFPTLASCRLDLPSSSPVGTAARGVWGDGTPPQAPSASPVPPTLTGGEGTGEPPVPTRKWVEVADCRGVIQECDVWITDPPYAEYVVYHELSEFFLAWYERRLPQLFPGWQGESRREQAVQGTDHCFRRGMADCYRNLARHTPANGVQVLLFTHQDAAVWADLTLILWEAGLRVTAAWCVRTETAIAGIKQGRHVPGTVVLVLRRHSERATVGLEELYPKLEGAVRRELQALAEWNEPLPGEIGCQMAACAAAVRLLTQNPVAGGDANPEQLHLAVVALIRAALASAVQFRLHSRPPSVKSMSPVRDT